jgi:PAS domain S-box-containing protein
MHKEKEIVSKMIDNTKVEGRNVISICVESDSDFKYLERVLRTSCKIKKVKDGIINGEIVDVHIIDEHFFERNKEHLIELKKLCSPKILPVILITNNRESQEKNPDVWKVVDDIVSASADAEYLLSRVELFLDYRLKTEKMIGFENLERKKKLMDSIFDKVHSCIYVKDMNGNYKIANRAFLDLFGVTIEEILEKGEKELLGSEIRNAMAENDLKALKSKSAIESEEKFKVDDALRTYRSVKYSLHDLPGYEDCIFGVSTDISEHKGLLYQLAERYKEKKCLIDVFKAIETHSEPQKIIEEVVRIIPEGFKYPDHTFAKVKFGELEYSSEGYLEGNHLLESKVRFIQGSPLQIKIVLDKEILQNNEKAFLDEEFDLINNISHDLEAHFGRVTNLQKLKESEQRWENLVKNDPDLILIVQDGFIKFVNNAGARMYGASPEKLIGKRLFDLILVDDKEAAYKRMQTVLGGEAVKPYIHKVLHPKTGEVRYLSIQSVPALHLGKRAIQMVGTDLTDRVEFENKLKKSIQEKEVLLQEVHHRVKNNLAVVSGLLQLQLFGSENTELKNILVNSVSRISSIALVHEHLYGNDSLTQIDFKDYIQELSQEIIKTLNNNKNIQIFIDSENIMLNINQAVPCALILNEMITNSFKHAFVGMDKGEIRISLKKQLDRIYVAIQDNGIGVCNDLLEKSGSLGITIINTLKEQLEANLKIENRNGTSIAFDFNCSNMNGSSANILD